MSSIYLYGQPLEGFQVLEYIAGSEHELQWYQS